MYGSASANAELPTGSDLKCGIWDEKHGLPSKTSTQGTALQAGMEKVLVPHEVEDGYWEVLSDETHNSAMAVSSTVKGCTGTEMGNNSWEAGGSSPHSPILLKSQGTESRHCLSCLSFREVKSRFQLRTLTTRLQWVW